VVQSLEMQDLCAACMFGWRIWTVVWLSGGENLWFGVVTEQLNPV
jgi:hypothetical protein